MARSFLVVVKFRCARLSSIRERERMPGGHHPPGSGWIGKKPMTTAFVLGFGLIVGALIGFKIQVILRLRTQLAGWL